MLVTDTELIAALERERADGKTIAFANGCFDLLHAGHVRYLQGAAAEADRLVVAINDDESVAALKGPGRPILCAADRAELVAGLRGVDYVVVFGDRTVERLLLLWKRTCTARDRLHDRHGTRTRGGRVVRRPHGHRRRSEASRHARDRRAHQGRRCRRATDQ